MSNFSSIDFNLFICLQLLSIPVYVVLHELGHAMPAAFLTKKPVKVFVGSYGDETRSFKISFGLITFWCKCNPLKWTKGICKPTAKNIEFSKQVIFVLGGPIVPLVVAAIVYFLAQGYNTPSLFKSFAFVFLFYSFVMFLIGITPLDIKIKTHTGRLIHTDGFVLIKILRLKKYNKEYSAALKSYQNKDYKQAGELFNFLLTKKIYYQEIYRCTISSLLMAKDYDGASVIFTYFNNSFTLNSDDYCNWGLSKLYKASYEEARMYFEKSLALNADNICSLNNIGYNYILTSEFEKAIPFLDKAISLNPAFAPAFCNKGLAKIKSGDVVEGLNSIQKATELDPSSAYPHRNLGIYCQDIGSYSEALSHFNKAKELNANTHLIDELIRETEVSLIKQTAQSQIITKASLT